MGVVWVFTPALTDQVKGSDGMFRNRGGGSLYGASDEEMAGAGQAEAAREEIRGVDIVYLKNVVLKFIEAAVREDVPQRDALLPAIATLVQATPQVLASQTPSPRFTRDRESQVVADR